MLQFKILLVNSSVERKCIENGIEECILLTNVNYLLDAPHSLLPTRWLRAQSSQNCFVWDWFPQTSKGENEWIWIIILIWTRERLLEVDEQNLSHLRTKILGKARCLDLFDMPTQPLLPRVVIVLGKLWKIASIQFKKF